MKNILMVFVFLLIFVKVGFSQEGTVGYIQRTPKPYGVDKEWRTCSFNSDCVAALRGCWAWEPINKKFMKDFLERNPPNCRKSGDPGMQPEVVCEMMSCQATNKTTGVSGNDWLRAYWGI